MKAAYRDASWFARPDVRSPKRAHLVDEDGQPRCRMATVLGEEVDAAAIPEVARCRRPGCRQNWPEPST